MLYKLSVAFINTVIVCVLSDSFLQQQPPPPPIYSRQVSDVVELSASGDVVVAATAEDSAVLLTTSVGAMQAYQTLGCQSSGSFGMQNVGFYGGQSQGNPYSTQSYASGLASVSDGQRCMLCLDPFRYFVRLNYDE